MLLWARLLWQNFTMSFGKNPAARTGRFPWNTTSDQEGEDGLGDYAPSDSQPTERFRILAQARSQLYLDLLKALLIKKLAPSLCHQKFCSCFEFVLTSAISAAFTV